MGWLFGDAFFFVNFKFLGQFSQNRSKKSVSTVYESTTYREQKFESPLQKYRRLTREIDELKRFGKSY